MKKKISRTLLLSIYSAIPLGFLFIVIDQLFLDAQLRATLPSDPNSYLWFTFIFTLPHIFAGFFGYFDRDYVKNYGPMLLKGARIVALVSIVLPLISLSLTFLVFAVYTMVHVFFQQSGIAKSLMKGANGYHQYWQFYAVWISALLYINVYASFGLIDDFIELFVLGLALIYTYIGLRASEASKTKIGSYYFWATHLTPIAGAAFLILGYPILTIAIPRIIHDLTAFTFYVSHDNNRFAETGKNYIYRVTSKLKIPVMIASPVLAITIAAPFQLMQADYTFAFLMFIFLYHYYTEGFVWKNGSLHRKYIEYIGQ